MAAMEPSSTQQSLRIGSPRTTTANGAPFINCEPRFLASASFSMSVLSSTTTNCHALWLLDGGGSSAARIINCTASGLNSSSVNFLWLLLSLTKSLNSVISLTNNLLNDNP